MSALSPEFEQAFDCGGGSCRASCDCGREHFDWSSGGYSWERGELEGLLERSRTTPDKVIGHDGSVGWMYVAGRQFVYDCPCLPDTAAKYERFIVDHAHAIAEFLNARTQRLREEAANAPTVQPIVTEGGQR